MWAPEKRQRVPRACDECKRKKKQCSGSNPCTLCTSKSLMCAFSNAARSEGTQRATVAHNRKHSKRKLELLEQPPIGSCENPRLPTGAYIPKDASADDEAPTENPGRLLQDGGGRLLYLGDSATLSFLQSIRRLVTTSLGPSPFTMDLSRHKILEATISTPPSQQLNYSLPDLEAAQYLVDSFFANIIGLFDIFDKPAFMKKFLETYKYPMEADPQWLCHLNLVFAIGLRMRKDITAPTPEENSILQRLEGGVVKRDVVFYATAKQLSDPVAGLEDGGVATVQSLLLMTIYMLASSKRNSAWGYMGMAVNLAYAIGVHKEEALLVFSSSEQAVRRKLWHSLYIMDCFLAASLGRPNSINYDTALDSRSFTPLNQSSGRNRQENNELHFSVTASKVIGDILSRIYHKREASRSVAYALSLRLSEWMKELPDELHWRRISAQNEGQDLALKRLHVNMIYFHAVLLLTRPFLLHQITRQLERTTRDTSSYSSGQRNQPSSVDAGRPEQDFCFHGACVRSAMHTITGIYAVYSISALPRRDPFVIYWLFSATLIILANVFCPVYLDPDSGSTIQKALTVMEFCGATDPQARRYQTIIEAFHNVLTAEATKKIKAQGTRDGPGGPNIFNVLFGPEGTDVGIHDDANLWGASESLNGRGSATVNAREIETQQSDPNSLDALCNLAGLGSTGSERWMNGVLGPDEMTEADRIWWPEAQDSFVSTDDMQLSLYGLMEST